MERIFSWREGFQTGGACPEGAGEGGSTTETKPEIHDIVFHPRSTLLANKIRRYVTEGWRLIIGHFHVIIIITIILLYNV